MVDFINLILSPIGWPHTVACLVAMAVFFPLMFIRKGGAKHRAWGRVYGRTQEASIRSSLVSPHF
jgi:hypothetical protein